MAPGPGVIIFHASSPGNKPLPAEMDGPALVPGLRAGTCHTLCAARAMGAGLEQPPNGLFCRAGAAIPDF